MTEQRTANDLIDGLNESELPASEKVWLFIQMCNADLLIKELTKKALFAKMELDVISDVDSFAYAVLKLAKPHLFEDEDV